MIQKYVPKAARLLLGLMFFVFGLNGFFQFLPMPPPAEPGAQAFLGALAQSGYFFPFLKAVEVLCAVCLLTGLFAPLALIVLAPVVVNILMYHRFLAGGPPMDIFILALGLVAALEFRDLYAPLLRAKPYRSRG